MPPTPTRILPLSTLGLLVPLTACVITDNDADDGPTTQDTSGTEGDTDDDTEGPQTSEGGPGTSDTDTADTGTTGGDGPVTYDCDDPLPETLTNTASEVDYVFACDIVVTETLVVEFGTVIEVAPGVQVSADGGKIVLKGTAADPVVLRAADPAMPWAGLRFFGTEDMSQLDFARIEDAGAESVVGSAAVLVGAESFGPGWVSIRDCVIDGSAGYGLSATLGTLDAFERSAINDTTIPAQLSVDTVGMLGAETDFSGNAEEVVELVGLIQPNAEPKAWNPLAVPYRIGDAVSIGGPNTLEAGVRVQMLGEAATLSTAGGSIIALGTSDAPIEITSADGSPWNSVFLSSADNRFEFVHFVGGSGASNLFDQAGMVTLDANTESTVEIRDCVFEGSAGWGIWLGNDGYNDDIDTANMFVDNALGDVRFP